jgi:hypothetical protein
VELTRKQVLREIEEGEKDLSVFIRARDEVRRRVVEVTDSPPRLLPFVEWSGTYAVLGTLDLACHAIERTLEELRQAVGKVPEKPALRLVKEEEDDEQGS